MPKVSVLIFFMNNLQHSTSLFTGVLVMTLTAGTYLFQLDQLSQSWPNAVLDSRLHNIAYVFDA